MMVEANRVVLVAAPLPPGGEGRLSYTKSKLKAVGSSLSQFCSVLEYFWHLREVF